MNHRTVVEYKGWNPSTPDDINPIFVGKRVAIHGKKLWVSRNSIFKGLVRDDIDGRDIDITLIYPNACYSLNCNPSDRKYAVNGPHTPWKRDQSYSSGVNSFSATVQLFQPEQVKQVLDLTNDTYEGRPTVRVTLLASYGLKSITHLDRTTYQHLYTESDKVFDRKNLGNEDEKIISKTEYRTEGGKLWPTRHERYYITAGGKKRLFSEDTFLEYAPYTPTADELDIEKQFGVKLVPPEPRPDPATLKLIAAPPRAVVPTPPAGNQTWMYGVGCLVFVVVVVAVLFRYR